MPRKSPRSQMVDTMSTIAANTLAQAQNRLSPFLTHSTTNINFLLLIRLAQFAHYYQLQPTSARQQDCVAYLLVSLAECMMQQYNITYSWLKTKKLKSSKILESVVILQATHILKSRRYLKEWVPRGRSELCASIFHQFFHEAGFSFRQLARMSRESFENLLSQINMCDVFFNRSPHSQAPVAWQLLVALANLGTCGNGGSYGMVARTFSISEGSVENYTNRCIYAIMHLQAKYIKWPNQLQRAHIKAKLAGQTFFHECVGYVDGTIIPLECAPVLNKEDYWMRKMTYGLNIMVVCDPNCQILYAQLGWCGSAHDQRVFRSSQLHQAPQDFFSTGEYLLADSGYSPSSTVVPAFKRSRGEQLERKKRNFNFELSHDRVAVEHCIGLLKSRWQSLKNLRILLRGPATAKRANFWIATCLILHNFLLSNRDDWNDQQVLNIDTQASFDLNPLRAEFSSSDVSNDRRRAELFSDFVGQRLS